MYGFLWLTAAMFAFTPSLQAQDLMDWLQDATTSSRTDAPSDTSGMDMAELVTLEPGESEMYPRVSPGGKYLLVVSGKSRKPVITRRLIENGDPLNLVSEDDPQALGSIAWHGDDSVTFLSYRADSLGLWKKPVVGGVIRRFQRIDGELTSPILLDDDSIIAVRLPVAPKRLGSSGHKKSAGPGFDNWNMRGKQPYMVHISKSGAERKLTSGVNPALSPNGKRLVFSMQEGRNWHLFMMNVDGSGLIQLTEGRDVDVQPTWSPDGKWIAFTSNRGKQVKAKNAVADMHLSGKSNWDIWLISHDGRGLTRLTENNARDGAPGIAKNGRVYFHSDRKVSKENRGRHQVKGRTGGFHIWSVALPAKVS